MKKYKIVKLQWGLYEVREHGIPVAIFSTMGEARKYVKKVR